MDIEKTILPRDASKELWFLQNKIALLESIYCLESVEDSFWTKILKKVFPAGESDLKIVRERLTSIQTEVAANSNGTIG